MLNKNEPGPQGENFTPKNPWIMHPNSVASSTILLISGILLIYSAVQVPLDIGFYWNADVCDVSCHCAHFAQIVRFFVCCSYTYACISQSDPALIKLNVFVDTFFVFEVCVTFFVGVWHKGEYVVTTPILAPTSAILSEAGPAA